MGCPLILREKDGIQWLEFEQFQEFPHLKHGVILNPDGEQHIEALTGCNAQVIGDQCHGTHVSLIQDLSQTKIQACDGLMTSLKNVAILTRHADCQAVLIYDPVKKVIANVHCGWRGSVGNIIAAAITKMPSCPEDLHVCISPSLSAQAAEFINHESELPEHFHRFQTKPNHFDFWEISKHQLTSLGVLDHHIEIAQMCTYADLQFFSARRDRTQKRHISFIGLFQQLLH